MSPDTELTEDQIEALVKEGYFIRQHHPFHPNTIILKTKARWNHERVKGYSPLFQTLHLAIHKTNNDWDVGSGPNIIIECLRTEL